MHVGWTATETARRLVSLSPGSTSQINDLRPVVDLIHSKPELRETYHEHSPKLEELRSDPDIAAALEEYLAVYGVRTPALDLIEPTLQETPYLIESLLQTLVQYGFPEPPTDAQLDNPGIEGSARGEYRRLLKELKSAYAVRDENVLWTIDTPIGLLRMATLEMGRRLHQRGILKHLEDVFFLYLAEAVSALLHGTEPGEVIDQRRGERLWARNHQPAPYLGPPPQPTPDMRGLPREIREVNEALMWITQHDVAAPAQSDGLTGSGASTGIYRGPVRIVKAESDFASLRSGEVIVAPVANPAWAVLFPLAGALVTDTGGILSHAAILAREFGVPAVMGVRGATTTLTNGQVVTVNGKTGSVLVDPLPGND